jgi:hypothetical protein
MSDPTPPDLSQQNLGYQRAAEFLVHYIRKDSTAGNALLNEFGNSKDELERFIFALAEYAIAGAPAVATKRCAGPSSSWNARRRPTKCGNEDRSADRRQPGGPRSGPTALQSIRPPPPAGSGSSPLQGCSASTWPRAMFVASSSNS